MKKCLAVLLALVLTLSFFTFTVSADDMEATPYGYACASCRQQMRATLYTGLRNEYVSAGCSASNEHHVHYDEWSERDWICANEECPAFAWVARRDVLAMEYNICCLVRPIT